MPRGLVRYQQTGDLHFITFSCYRRQPNLGTAAARSRLESSLEAARARYKFQIYGYVVMPEHVHLLITEPEDKLLAVAIQALKQSVSRHLSTGEPFWQDRYYDFNVFTERKRVDKLRYIHRNPVTRHLVSSPEQWQWSSFQQYASGNPGTVTVCVPWLLPAAKAEKDCGNVGAGAPS